MRVKLNPQLIIFFLIVITAGVWAQDSGIDKVGTTSFQFLKVIPEARATGMGEAYTAITNGADAVFWNPAALTKLNSFDVSISYLDWLLDIKHHSVSLGYNLGAWGAIGFQAMVADVGDIEVTTVSSLYRLPDGSGYNPGLTGEVISPGSQLFGLSFAKKITESFAFGLTAKYAHEDLVRETAGMIMFDAGLVYETGFKLYVLRKT